MKSGKLLLLLTCATALAMALGLAACGGGASSSAASSTASASSAAASSAAASSGAAPSAAASSAATSSAAASSAAASNASTDAALTAADLANVDIEIALDDFDSMFALAKDIQNGNATGKVVKIDGYVLNFAKGMSYSVVERNADNTEKQGTVFVIEGVDEDAYPSDGTHVILTGKVIADDSFSFNIHTLLEFVEVVEDAQ